MNAELQRCRDYYYTIPGKLRSKPLAQSLLKAIQIAERSEWGALALANAVRKLRRGDFPPNEQPLWDELQAGLARVTKKEGE